MKVQDYLREIEIFEVETGKKPIPLRDYERHLMREQSDKDFFKVLRVTLTKMGMDVLEAVFLQDLMNRENMKYRGYLKKRKRWRMRKAVNNTAKEPKPAFDRQGYFRCTVNYLEDIWTAKRQERLIPILVKKGFINIKRAGAAGERWLKVNRYYFNKLIDQIEGGEMAYAE